MRYKIFVKPMIKKLFVTQSHLLVKTVVNLYLVSSFFSLKT